ncbi:MAG: PAS domain S-box protein [Bacteroidota bacterium]
MAIAETWENSRLSLSPSSVDMYWWQWDCMLRRITLSDGLMERLGYTKEDFDPSEPSIYKLIHPDDIEPNLIRIRSLINGEIDHYEFEYRIRNDRDGWDWFYNRGSVQERNDDGSVKIIGGIVMNISGRYKGIMNRIEDEQKFEFIFKNINEPVLVIRLNGEQPGEIADLNEAACTLTGYRPSELKGHNVSCLISDIPPNITELVGKLKTGEQVSFNASISDTNGRIHPLEVQAYGYTRLDQELVVVLLRDRTSDLENMARLERSEAKFESLFSNAPVGIAMLDPEGRVVLVNRGFRECFPSAGTKITGRSVWKILGNEAGILEKCITDIAVGKRKFCSETFTLTEGTKTGWYAMTLYPVLSKGREIEFLIMTTRDITREKEMEMALRESEKLYRTLIEAAEDRIGLFRMDMSPVFMNSAFAGVLGFTVDEYMQVEEMSMLHPDDRATILSRREEFLREGYMANEYRIRHRKGHYLNMYSKMVIIRGASPEEDLILSIVRDVTERQETIQKLKRSEFRYKRLLEALPDSILQVDSSGNIRDYHFAPTNMLRIEKDDFEGLRLEDIYPETVLAEVHEKIAEVFNNSGPVLLEHETRTDSSRRFFETRIIQFSDQEVLMIIRDITFRQVSEMAVRESEARYRALVEAADDRIALYNTKGERILTNTAYYKQLGYTLNEYEHLPYGSLLHPDDRYLFKGRGLPLHLIGKKSQKVLEYRMKHRNGHFLDMMAKIVPVHDADRQHTGFLEIVRDITPLKKVEQQLRLAKEKAEESDLLKSAFLANMSHEIRTPMNSIVGFSNLLTNPTIDSDTREEYVRRINRNSEQLLALISDIIDLAKIESRQLSIVRSRVMVNQVMQELMDQYTQELRRTEKTGLKLVMECGSTADDLAIITDFVRLTQVLQNLLNNAIKFTREGVIRFGYRLIPKNRILFYVADTGIGIARENFDIIFDQFRQVDGSQTRKFGGTGLGLAICKNLVNLMGGKIWVESELDKGAIFYTDLPLGEPGPGTVPEEKQEPQNELGVRKEKISVIVVDDNLDTQVLFISIFRELGIIPLVAGSSEDLLGLIRAGSSPDLIMLDIQLPDVGGDVILPLLRNLVPACTIVAQSAFALSGDRERYSRAGFDDYITKPFDRQDILRILHSLS